MPQGFLWILNFKRPSTSKSKSTGSLFLATAIQTQRILLPFKYPRIKTFICLVNYGVDSVSLLPNSVLSEKLMPECHQAVHRNVRTYICKSF